MKFRYLVEKRRAQNEGSEMEILEPLSSVIFHRISHDLVDCLSHLLLRISCAVKLPKSDPVESDELAGAWLPFPMS
jgi:hypothetical protein